MTNNRIYVISIKRSSAPSFLSLHRPFIIFRCVSCCAHRAPTGRCLRTPLPANTSFQLSHRSAYATESTNHYILFIFPLLDFSFACLSKIKNMQTKNTRRESTARQNAINSSKYDAQATLLIEHDESSYVTYGIKDFVVRDLTANTHKHLKDLSVTCETFELAKSEFWRRFKFWSNRAFHAQLNLNITNTEIIR